VGACNPLQSFSQKICVPFFLLINSILQLTFRPKNGVIGTFSGYFSPEFEGQPTPVLKKKNVPHSRQDPGRDLPGGNTLDPQVSRLTMDPN
jgi:hypothetical protein